jgi:XkdW protein
MYDKLIKIYPELVDFDFASGVITLQNDSDGRGDYIKEWTHELPQPTAEQLGAV